MNHGVLLSDDGTPLGRLGDNMDGFKMFNSKMEGLRHTSDGLVSNKLIPIARFLLRFTSEAAVHADFLIGLILQTVTDGNVSCAL